MSSTTTEQVLANAELCPEKTKEIFRKVLEFQKSPNADILATSAANNAATNAAMASSKCATLNHYLKTWLDRYLAEQPNHKMLLNKMFD